MSHRHSSGRHGCRSSRGDHEHHDHERDDGGSRRGHRRLLGHGDLRLLMLHLIAGKPRHGYELIKAIEDAFDGAYSPSPGVIYPTLTLLEELGHVTIRPGDGAKKLHDITDEGRAHLDAYRPTLDAVLARIAQAQGRQGGAGVARILQAIENLQHALRARLTREPPSDDQAAAIAAAIDAVSAEVNRR